MDCSAYCTAYDYDIKSLFESLRQHHTTTFQRDVLHLEIIHEDRDNADFFFFSYGVFVAWNASSDEIQQMMEKARPHEITSLKRTEKDNFTYSYGYEAGFSDDHITLPDERAITKLAFSHALAQTVKLGVFEIAIRETFQNTRYLPESLAKNGKISLSRKQLRCKIGELFIVRSSINLHAGALDTPEFFWDNPEFEDIYRLTSRELDIHSRTQTLNQQLDVIHELFGMFSNELNHQHSSLLEWAIIALIIMEVLILVGHDVFSII